MPRGELCEGDGPLVLGSARAEQRVLDAEHRRDAAQPRGEVGELGGPSVQRVHAEDLRQRGGGGAEEAGGGLRRLAERDDVRQRRASGRRREGRGRQLA